MTRLALGATFVLVVAGVLGASAFSQKKPKPPPSPVIWGVVDAAVLGTCSASVHNQYIINGGDNFYYRTWHPLIDPSGCSYAHEHGQSPSTQAHATIRARPVLFGYAARRMPSPEEPNGHAEAHEGYKVFVINRNEVNDEGRTSLIDSRIVAHMGTAAPKRFLLRHHSIDIDVIDSVGKGVSLRMMGDTGSVLSVNNGSYVAGCDPRNFEDGQRAVLTLMPNCLQRPYEFWTFVADVGLAHAVVSIAVFDPLGVRDPSNPLRLVPVASSEVDAIMDFPSDPRGHFRGCEREHYAGPVYWYNPYGVTSFITDAMGTSVGESNPYGIWQHATAHDTIDFKGSHDGLSQFKQRKAFCGPSLGLKN